ncbi:MAG TPA: substrate-binding domain-containing protein [Anaerolineae bacterium]|nr:substrate-binding domain-containing protein [Anaerolineae bacterium]
MNRRTVKQFLLVALIVGLMVGCGTRPAAAPAAAGGRLLLATTTSTQDSGLLDEILPVFEEQAGVSVEVIAVGTGQAIELGEAGDADVLLVHARSREDAFMDAGHGVRREDVMYNDFIIVGPPSDPAGIAGMTDAAAAFAQIAEAEAPFVSRGDDSGTNTKEKAVWSAADIEPAADWYISAGQGMGAVLTMADEQQAYTLSDRATYLARTLEGTELVIVVEGDPILFNPYGVIAVNPEKSAEINDELANEFIDWIISVPTQEMIANFGVTEFGTSLFIPDSAAWREAHPAEGEPAEGGVPADAALKVTGNVASEIGWTEEQVRAMPTIDAESTNKDGETKPYTGVLINDLLTLAGPNADAPAVVFVTDDGYTGEVALAEMQGCADCILSFREQGGFGIVMPGFAGNVQVKGAIEIQVK